jgi:hypothetical protein
MRMQRTNRSFSAAACYYALTAFILASPGWGRNDAVAKTDQTGAPATRSAGGSSASHFLSPVTYQNFYYPTDVAVADFNHDGKPDLAITSGNVVVVMLGNGDGTFGDSQSYLVGDQSEAVAIADFNADGNLDLAVTDDGLSIVAVLLGNGDGTFQAGVQYATGGTGCVAVLAGDFNGDGKPDLVVSNNDIGNLSFLPGRGDGTFGSPKILNSGRATGGLAAADFNGDHKLDLAIANGVSVTVMLGNGNGTFQSPVTYTADQGPVALIAPDVNSDGNPDLVVANGTSKDVSVLLGNGDGTFQAPVDYAVGTSPYSLASLDLNGDGKPDLVVDNYDSGDNGSVSVLLGNGDGTFRTQPQYSVGQGRGPTAVAAGDFNLDHNADLAVACALSGSVSILLGNGDGTLQTTYDERTGFTGVKGVAVGDFNLDRKTDLAVAGSAGVSVLLGNGKGGFQPAVSYPTDDGSLAVVVADFNGDGKPDLATANGFLGYPNNVSVLLSNGDGTFQTAVNYRTGGAPGTLAAGDVNGDGKMDLVVTTNAGLIVLLGNGDGTFQSPILTPDLGFLVSVAVADFNGDNKLDVAVSATFNGVEVLLGNGDGTFQLPFSYSVNGPGVVQVADFNRDGKTDLAVASDGNGFTGDVTVLLGHGDGTFSAPVVYGSALGGIGLASGDFNGDGKIDLAVGGSISAATSIVCLLLGNGDGTFQTATDYYPGASPSFLAAAQLNGDKALDLVTTLDQGNVGVMLNIGGTGVAVTSSLNPSELGQPVTFTAMVKGTVKGSGVPGGSVSFRDGTALLGTVALSSGTASFNTSGLSAGEHTITAAYLGNGSFNSNLSGPLVQTVDAAPKRQE